SVGLEIDGNAESPQIISYEEYHPYGTTAYQANDVRLRGNKKRFKYTGMERDEETGLSYHTARYYLPWLGRWGSVDPLDLVDGLNLYAYTCNNPIGYVDEAGTQARPTPLEEERRSSLPSEHPRVAREQSAEMRAPPEGNMFDANSLDHWRRALTGAGAILGQQALETLREVATRGIARFIPIVGQAAILYDLIELVRNLPDLV